MKKTLSLLIAALAAGTGLLVTTTSAHAASTASVTVVHGIPNTPVNVFVNGKDALPNFKPGTVAGPLQLPGGAYDVTVFPAANTTGKGTPVIEAKETITGGENVTLVAHLTAAGTPTITPYVNDVSMIPAGQARLIVRHTAAAPAVDVRANGKVAFAGVTNPKQVSAELPAGSIKADVVLTGTSNVVVGPASLQLPEGMDTIVYAIGSAKDKTLGLIVQRIGGMHSAPNGVPAGSGGFAAPRSAIPAWAWLVSGLGILMAFAGGLAARRTMPVRR